LLQEDVDINDQLQKYFEFAANVWLSFAPGDYKQKFPRDFKFLVTVPHSFLGDLPAELQGVPHLEVSIVAQDGAATGGSGWDSRKERAGQLRILWQAP